MKKIILTSLSAGLCFLANAQTDRCNLPWVDLSDQTHRQAVVSQGTDKLYNGHPTTVLMDDNKTMWCTWTHGHGGCADFLAKSEDAGLTWKQMPTPEDWKTTFNCPSIYRLTDPSGKERIMIFSARPGMSQTYSEDDGKTWSPVRSLGKPCVMAFSSIIRLKDGRYLGMYHRGHNDRDARPLTLWQSVSEDGGLTWGESVKVGELDGHSPCEPCMFRDPSGKQIICVARENNRVGHSLMMTSNDEGRTWSTLKETPWGLSGDRHMIKYAKDGRLVAVFRDQAPNSPTKGHFVAWVGTYKDLREGTSGQYRIKLLHSYAGSDCGYSGLEILSDGTFVATTYIKLRPGKERHSVVSVRFNLDETDKMVK